MPAAGSRGISSTVEVQGYQSYRLETSCTTAYITQRGGMMAPVRFSFPSGRTVSPYYVSPWAGEVDVSDPPVLGPLRGDFFCLPFGADNRVGEEDHLPHGESSYGIWEPIALRESSTHLSARFRMNYSRTRGEIEKRIHLSGRHPVIYVEHLLAGFSGLYPLGYHAILSGNVPKENWKFFTGEFEVGMTDPSYCEPSANGEYYALRPGTEFTNLETVQTRWKDQPTTDCSVFPTRAGFIDIYAIYRKAATTDPLESRIGWIAVYNRSEKYLWYSLKDASVLPATVFWAENGGRHHFPWYGRNSCIGVEETCTFFAAGRAPSIAENSISERGIATAMTLSHDEPSSIRSIQGVVEVDLDESTGIRSLDVSGGSVAFATDSGKPISIPAEVDFLETGELSER